ncbi:MAG: hypothetical protein PHH14_03690 [Candidatus Margulisbacteria bacterium]|nr:hypothetical protein [Candidatus Margulisiibacteriota bacterium]
MLKFKTDGWSGAISEDFTFENVRKIAQMLAIYIISEKPDSKPILIGHDSRFLADQFATAVTQVMESSGIPCFIAERDLPVPVAAWAATGRDTSGTILITGGNYPAYYCGLRIFPAKKVAPEMVARKVDTYFILEHSTFQGDSPSPELLSYQSARTLIERSTKKGKLEHVDPRDRYLKYAAALVDRGAIKKAALKIVVDPFYGSGRGYLDRLLQQLGCRVEAIRDYRDVLFGGLVPEPVENNLAELKNQVAESKADLGIALSGGAGRFAVIDREGNYHSGEALLGLLKKKKKQVIEGDGILGGLQIVELIAKEGLRVLSEL